MKRIKLTRETVLFVSGLAGVAYETLVEQADRPILLAVFGGMMGLPAFLSLDKKPKDDDDTTPSHPDDIASKDA